VQFDEVATATEAPSDETLILAFGSGRPEAIMAPVVKDITTAEWLVLLGHAVSLVVSTSLALVIRSPIHRMHGTAIEFPSALYLGPSGQL
jgi:hypothetical protein